jgi:uncharacterized Zn ribbon protein
MKPYLRFFQGLLLLAASTGVFAQAAPTSSATQRVVPDAKAEQLNVKDDAVLIEELRIRGETKRLSVTPKNAPTYQISPESGSKPLDDKTQGQRTWRLLSF